MTCEYTLADKLRNKYYIRNDASQYGRPSAQKSNPYQKGRQSGDTVMFSRANGAKNTRMNNGRGVDTAARNTNNPGSISRNGAGANCRTGGGMNGSAAKKANVGTRGKYSSASGTAKIKSNKTFIPEREIKIKKKYLNPLYIACLFVVTVMMMSLVTCFSQVSSTAREISGLERELSSLRTQEAELSEKLDEKNDMRLIETIATTKLGMVKEDSLQRKYISLSEGEYIELSEEEETNNASGGVMLSSILSSLDKFFDRFK